MYFFYKICAVRKLKIGGNTLTNISTELGIIYSFGKIHLFI